MVVFLLTLFDSELRLWSVWVFFLLSVFVCVFSGVSSHWLKHAGRWTSACLIVLTWECVCKPAKWPCYLKLKSSVDAIIILPCFLNEQVCMCFYTVKSVFDSKWIYLPDGCYNHFFIAMWCPFAHFIHNNLICVVCDFDIEDYTMQNCF